MYSRVYVEITNICNMNCSFCHGHSRDLRRMSEAEFALVLGKLKGNTDYIYYHLMGEPLTHPELPLFLRMAAERGFKSVITTNGTLLDKCGDEILSAGLHKVSLSVHSFEKYMKTLIDFAVKASGMGVIVVFRLWNKGFDGGRNEVITDYLKNYISGDWTENSKGLRIREKMFLEWGERFQWPDKNAGVYGEDVFCYGLRDHFGILCDGTVVPCCLDSDGVINLGNIFTQTLSDILQSERAKNMKYGFDCRKATEDLCRKCGYAQRFSK